MEHPVFCTWLPQVSLISRLVVLLASSREVSQHQTAALHGPPSQHQLDHMAQQLTGLQAELAACEKALRHVLETLDPALQTALRATPAWEYFEGR